MNRMKVRGMKIQVLDNNTGEILTLRCKPEELPRVMEIYNILNNMGQFSIRRIYTSGDVEETVVRSSTQVVWERVREED